VGLLAGLIVAAADPHAQSAPPSPPSASDVGGDTVGQSDTDLAKKIQNPIGAQGAAAIFVNGDQGSWAALRKIAIRARTWLAWLYPL